MPEPLIEVGDHVTVGKGTLTWEVLEIESSRMRNDYYRAVILKSGRSDRLRGDWYGNLTLHTKGSK